MAVIKKPKDDSAPSIGYVIGVDPSLTATGIVVLGSSGKLILQQCVKSKLTGWPRLVEIAGYLQNYMDDHKPALVVFEGYALSKFGGSIIGLVEIGTILRGLCWHAKQPYVDVSPTVVKKFATGKGNAPKDQVTMHVHKSWGFEAPDNNVADAYVLAQMGRELVWPGRPGFSKDRVSLCANVCTSLASSEQGV